MTDYKVLLDGSTEKSYDITSYAWEATAERKYKLTVFFKDVNGDIKTGESRFFRIGSVTTNHRAVNGNVVAYSLSQGRFIYPNEVSLNVDSTGRAPVATLTFLSHLWGDVICASYIPDTGAPLTQDGIATLGSDRVFVEDISDCMSTQVYPVLLLRGNPITNDATMMIRKATLYVSEYER